MKTLKSICFGLIILITLNACEDISQEIKPDSSPLAINSEEMDHIGSSDNPGGKMVTIPFKANFYTNRSYDDAGIGKCTEDPFLAFNLQVGEGNATHLGKFTTSMWFCGSGFDYKNGEGVFIADNGDELYFNVPSAGEVGHVLWLPNEHPVYELYFKDPFSFNGGTGQFANASGGGYTDSYVDLLDDDGNFIPEHRTDHKWVGVLTLKMDL